MIRDKSKFIYILSLIILATLIILVAYGTFSHIFSLEKDSKTNIKFSRTDLYMPAKGNYSNILIQIFNNDTISHFYSINLIHNQQYKLNYGISVNANNTFTYSTNTIYHNMSMYNSSYHNFDPNILDIYVYMDNKTKPVEQIQYILGK